GHALPGTRVSVDGRALNVSPQGSFAFGFVFDQKESATIIAHYPDGSSENRTVTPLVRQYEVQAINGLPPQQAHPSDPDITDRIAREHALVAAARKTDSDIAAFSEP